MKVTIEEIVGAFIDRAIQPIFTGIAHMTKEVDDLKTAVGGLTTQVTAVKGVADTLKTKYDGAIAANVTLTGQNVALTAQVADLTAQLAAAQGAQADPADTAAIIAATGTVQTASQTLSDTAAADAPAN